MKSVIRKAGRWVFVSAPGVGVLVISAGLGIGYAATKDGGDVSRAPAPGPAVGDVLIGPGGKDLSDSDRQALDRFHECVRGKGGEPSEGNPRDPDLLDAAFEACKGELPEELRQKMEADRKQMEEFRSCMEENGAPAPPGARERPSDDGLEKLRAAHEACEDKLPEGGCAMPLPPPPGGPHGGPPGHGAFFAPGTGPSPTG